jgi:type IV secretion system protein TrbJ
MGRGLAFASGVSLVALIGVAAPRPAQAQLATVCVNCSTMITQLLQYAKDAQSMATQLQQYQTQLQQYTNMVTNTVSLPQEAWSTVQSDIMRVQALSNAASLLSGNSGSLISRLQNASAYANQAGSLANIPSQITGYQQTIGNNLSTMGKTLGLQQGQESSNAALLASLQAHSQNAVGQMQAIQAGNELAHQQATQLLQIQATLTSTAQMQATQMAVDADRQATNDASMQHFNSAPPVATTGYQQW